MSRILHWIVVVALSAGVALGSEEPPRAQDEREYELVQSAMGERDPAKRLEALDAWRSEYEETPLEETRERLYLQTYREAGKTREAYETAKKLLTRAPGDFAAEYTIAALAPVLGDIEEPALAEAERASKALLDGGIEAQFEAGKRPENVTEEAWAKARREAKAVSLRTLGWAAMQRKEHTEAEARLTKALEVDPKSAQASYWLAQSILAQRDPDKNEAAFFSLARAAGLEGEGALPEESREQIREYLYKIYEGFAGTTEGLDEIERLAQAHALPPPETPRVMSAQEREIEEERKLCEANPEMCAYRNLRRALEGDGGAEVWADLKGKLTPRLKLYVVGNEPAERPTALRLSSVKGGKAEVLLQLTTRRREPVPVGRAVSFEGVAESLRREPFLLTLAQGELLN